MLRRVLDDVLDFSKIEAGKLELEKERFAIRDSLEWSVGIFGKTALEKQLQLTLIVEDDVPNQLVGDATRIRQVLTNLISNALKFTEKGSVEVHAKTDVRDPHGDPYRLHVSVADTGIGIPADRIGRLFQSFSQVDPSMNRRYGGTGLGLAISKRIVEMMGGEITVESEPGVGTRFVFTLPLSEAVVEVQTTDQSSRPTTPKRVLVAEDNEINRIVIRRMLEKLGHVVDIVSDGDTAVRQIEQFKYDLFFTDLHMPGIDGFEIAQRIRALPSSNARIPVVALTASATAGDREACLAAGMNDHVSKPIDIETLRIVISRWTHEQQAPERDACAPQHTLAIPG
jgi:CheY-like chemotaxis protein